MYQQIIDRGLIQHVHEAARDNLYTLANCKIDNFFVYAISEGVFLCCIADQSTTPPKYQNIVVKLDKLNPLKNTLITSPKAVEILCAYEFHQNGLGPKLLSVFKLGRIEEYINGHLIGDEFNRDQELRKQVAECIAKINSIAEVKTEQNGNFLSNKVNIFMELIYKNRSNSGYSDLSKFLNERLSGVSEELNEGEEVTKIAGLENEFRFLTDYLEKLSESAEIVFSHNDLSQENIYERSDPTSTNNRLYVLNYDLSAYNYRGYDLAHYLNNIAFDYNNLPSSVDELNWITNEEMRQFLLDYLTKATSDHDLNQLIKEVKFFRVYSAYLSILVSVLTALSNEPIETNLDFLKLRIEIYLKFKNDFLVSFPDCIMKQ